LFQDEEPEVKIVAATKVPQFAHALRLDSNKVVKMFVLELRKLISDETPHFRGSLLLLFFTIVILLFVIHYHRYYSLFYLLFIIVVIICSSLSSFYYLLFVIHSYLRGTGEGYPGDLAVSFQVAQFRVHPSYVAGFSIG
jgi:hypothetical protein